ncbi:hypothetical protein C8F01DRAFT_1170649 [Mycena amicta]|nr:hypothetical protein C8F01DRAFT_1170649 [Mycena amicta]
MSRIPQRGTPTRPPPRTRTTSTTTPKLTTPDRVRTKSTAGRAPSPLKPSSADDPKPPTLREVIALKRAEAKKAQSGSRQSPLDDLGTLQDAIPNPPQPEDATDILSRPPLSEAIERAKSTGSINLSTRDLVCIPSALFDIHLGITPEPLKSVQEPPLPPAPDPPIGKKKRGPAWYEAHDLEILKAFGNQIAEIQPEIALFGSLKVVDLHKNKITSLPPQFADLANLTTLDLSHNLLTGLPSNIFSLPCLSNLNVSHNRLKALPFGAPFSQRPAQKSSLGGGGLFGVQIARATAPLPKLAILDASNNSLRAGDIDLDLPKGLISLDLSENALGADHMPKLFAALSKLARLKTLRLAKAAGVDDGLFADLQSSSSAFSALSVLDLGETGVSESKTRAVLQAVLSQELSFDVTNDDPPPGTTRVVIGKKVVRERWEIEAERRAKVRGKVTVPTEEGIAWPEAKPAPSKVTTTSAAAPEAHSQRNMGDRGGGGFVDRGQMTRGLVTTLTLPPTTSPPKSAGHARAFSLALDKSAAPRVSDVSLPTATMPLPIIAAQPFAATLRVLILQGRRVDRVMGCNLADNVAVAVSSSDDALSIVTTPAATEQRPLLVLVAQLFPSLKSLNLAYNLLTSGVLGETEEVLAELVLSTPHRAGLRSLILRGNRINLLDPFQELAMRFKNNRQVPGWTLEELDLRDNEIGKLPPEIGLLPLDVLLVDGNTFRVPARRVWEREGTKGLLSWLRGRME